ncbi:alpha/beta hydrolase [Streptomyces fumanus]|uniref:alpha/beta hydrolase n=1 Tax=Streptomyces fumanus TaxID=67302 RepID=UPI0033F4D6C3
MRARNMTGDRLTPQAEPGGHLVGRRPAPPAGPLATAGPAPRLPSRGYAVEVPAGALRLAGALEVPVGARAMAVLTTGSGRHRREMSAALRRAGLGTLVLELLHPAESAVGHNAFDIVLLARRLGAACDWLHGETGLPVGCAATGTRAAAALEAAAGHDTVRAVVCLSGRPELARPSPLDRVPVPVLLVTGGRGTRLLGRNRLAADWLRCPHRVVEIPDAADPVFSGDAACRVLALATGWLTGHLGGGTTAPAPPAPRTWP